MDPRSRFLDLVRVQSTNPDMSGTGWLVRPGLVLTALHCVADERTWQRAEKVYAFLGRELKQGTQRAIRATIEWPPADWRGNPPPDIAILRLDDPNARPQCPLKFGDWPDDETIAWTMGFPHAQQVNQPGPLAAEANLPGRCWTHTLTPPTLGFRSSVSVPSGQGALWKGLSGGPLVVGDMIVGVMRRFPDGWSAADFLEAEPLAGLLGERQDLRNLLGVLLPLAKLRGAVAAAIPSDFRKLSEIIHFFDRTEAAGDVLDTIGNAIAGGTSVEIIAVGREEDRCDDLATRIHEEALMTVLEDRTSGLLKVTWPSAPADPVSAVKTLCRHAGRNMSLRPPWPESWDAVAAQLQSHAVAPWFHVALPLEPTALDLHLLTEWRQCWSRVRRAGGEAAGYVLTLDKPLASNPLLRQQLESPPKDLLSRIVELGPHSLNHVKNWPGDIRTLSLQKVLHHERAKELERLARDLEPHVTSLGWINFSQDDLHSLLQGQI